MRTDLDRPVSLARHAQPDPSPSFIKRNLSLDRDNSSGLLVGHIVVGNDGWKDISVGNREEATVESPAEVAVIGADGVLNSNEICARGEGALDLDIVESGADRGKDVTTTEHCGAEGHEIGDGVVSITDEFVEIVCYKSLFGVLIRGVLLSSDTHRIKKVTYNSL